MPLPQSGSSSLCLFSCFLSLVTSSFWYCLWWMVRLRRIWYIIHIWSVIYMICEMRRVLIGCPASWDKNKRKESDLSVHRMFNVVVVAVVVGRGQEERGVKVWSTFGCGCTRIRSKEGHVTLCLWLWRKNKEQRGCHLIWEGRKKRPLEILTDQHIPAWPAKKK